ncbi:sarcosine oxidase subunit gamma [Pararhodobacter zhoushanensis]|uniref:Sarcosine oxidase subunit gamma n=1 Tax=Pararhodobacter zhoushanensis TaxID=2479545 RepID=A0ABT3GW89_9RHOB|nr:sarcosine oxidase subunit gamma family protein [Pararhodobacter zhoushanensis]MCW1931802.1 sarcosine oxidase subunit gamma [Pararhodobacter zhoushanensis]
MSEVVSALAGARASGMVELADAGATGMITLRGDPAVLGAAVQAVLGLAMPEVRRVVAGEGAQVLWMSPDELLVVTGYDAAPGLAAGLAAALGDAFATVAVVSDARAVITLSGAQARDVLAKLCPVDFADFPVGCLRRTRAAQVAAAVWRTSDSDWSLICFRSVAGYVWEALATVAQPGGEVALYR